MRSRLRGLAKDNADRVARHLAMANLTLESDPELAYRHARAAADRAGRIDVVREVAGVAAYRTARYAEALRELRTARRLTGSWELAYLEADCERGLARPERAVEFAKEALGHELAPEDRAELLVVLAGARADMGDSAAAAAELERALAGKWPPTARARIEAARLLFAGEDVPEALLEVADPREVVPDEFEVVDTAMDAEE